VNENLGLDFGVRRLSEREVEHPATGMIPDPPIIRMIYRKRKIAEVDDFHFAKVMNQKMW